MRSIEIHFFDGRDVVRSSWGMSHLTSKKYTLDSAFLFGVDKDVKMQIGILKFIRLDHSLIRKMI